MAAVDEHFTNHSGCHAQMQCAVAVQLSYSVKDLTVANGVLSQITTDLGRLSRLEPPMI